MTTPNNKFTNFAATTLASGISAGTTSISLTGGTGALFPSLGAGEYFYGTLVDTATGSTKEIVKVTARSTDTLTVTRAQDNTSASAFIAGDRFELRLVAASMQNFAVLETSSVQALNAQMIGGLTSSQIAQLTTSSVQALNAQLVGGLSTSQLAVLGTSSVQSLNVSLHGGLTTSQIAVLGTSQVAALGSIELGHLTDTTIARVSAGVVSIEGNNILVSGGALGTPASGTLTNCGSLPVSGITASTSTALGVGSVELGHASDTTISRVSAGKIAVEGVNVGTEGIVFNSQSAAYTTVLTDAGKTIFHPSTDANARTFTIDSNANVPYPVGTAITFINMTSNVVTIAITSDTMYLSSAGTTGSRSLAQYGVATAIKMTSTTWIINGSGLT